MNKMKVMTVVGTRPEIIRLSRVLARLDEHCDHVLVHTGQNYDYGLNQIFFDDLGIRKPDHFLNSAAGTIGFISILVTLNAARELGGKINTQSSIATLTPNSSIAHELSAPF